MKPRKMKDSGIPWIGEIPEGWGVNKLKYLTFMKSGEAIPASEIEESGEFPVYGGNGLRGFANRFTHDGFHLLIGRQGALCGNVHHADGKFWESEHAVVVTMIEKCDGNWIYYLLSAMKLNQYSESAAQPGISVDKVRNLSVPLPNTTEEQKKIAGYLDSRCGEIDRVIAAKERQNELLRDQRAAVIHEAVTKGLNPKAKFKESGYEWIGKIPADWTLDKIKWLGKSIIGLTYSPEEVASDGTLVLRASNIQGGQVVYDDNVYVRKEIPDEIVLRKDDILICSRNGSRALIGKCALIDEKVAGQTFGAFMTVLRSPANRYLFHVLNSQLFSFYLSAFLTSTINQLTTENLNNMVVPMPKTPAEQQQIAAHLDARCGEIDRVMAANEGMVAKLKEYRASLIWEAVTGKKCL